MEHKELFKIEKGHHKANSYTGIYGMHKYWSKKPYNIIRTFIEKYSSKNEIVLDPFCGSGISVVESIILGRKAIGIDINPVAIFIAEQMVKKIDISEVLRVFEEVKRKIKNEIDELYKIERDGKSIYATHFIWQGDKLMEIWYSNGNRKRMVFKPFREDEINAKKIKIEDIPYFYPQTSFFNNSRINTNKGRRVYDLFTTRNLYALSMLYNEIENVEKDEVRDLLKFVFTSSVGQSSKMVFVVNNRGKKGGNTMGKKEVGSWVIGYWTPQNFFEINVWRNFENRFKKILKAKKEQLYINYEIRETQNIQDVIYENANLCLLNKPAQKELKQFPDNSIDYIITDPPHGDRIPYLELSMLWNSWLKKEVNFEDEIIISNAKERKKDINDYNRLINDVFAEVYRILKPNRYFSLMFNSLDDETWINLITNLSKIGFRLSNIETLGYSANSVVQDNRKKGLKTDFVLTFRKDTSLKSNNIKILSLKEHKKYLEDKIFKIIKEEDNKEIYSLINQVFKYFLKKEEFFRISEVIKIINDKII